MFYFTSSKQERASHVLQAAFKQTFLMSLSNTFIFSLHLLKHEMKTSYKFQLPFSLSLQTKKTKICSSNKALTKSIINNKNKSKRNRQRVQKRRRRKSIRLRMDRMLCDELLQEIFQRLPPIPSSSLSVSLVSKRWLHLYRTSKTFLSLRLSPHNSTIPSLASFLSHYPSLLSLSLILSSDPTITITSATTFSEQLLLIVSTF